jgi:hypothetical protein
MTENNLTPPAEAKAKTESQAEPTLRLTQEQPRGVLQKNLKTLVYLGAVSLVIVAALVSSSGKKTPLQQASAKGQPPQPNLPDSTDNNVQEWKKQMQAESQREHQSTAAAAAIIHVYLDKKNPYMRIYHPIVVTNCG